MLKYRFFSIEFLRYKSVLDINDVYGWFLDLNKVVENNYYVLCDVIGGVLGFYVYMVDLW